MTALNVLASDGMFFSCPIESESPDLELVEVRGRGGEGRDVTQRRNFECVLRYDWILGFARRTEEPENYRNANHKKWIFSWVNTNSE